MTENKHIILFPKVKFGPNMAVVLAAASCLFLASCATVGPNYVPPAPEAPAAWNTPLQKGITAEPVNHRVISEWWAGFNDPVFSSLITQAVNGNLDLKQAKARIREARARRGIADAGFFPTLDASGNYTESHNNESTNDLYRAGFDAGWEIDIFGRIRRSVEAAEDNLQASFENLRDVLVSLTAEVGLNYTEARTFQRRLAVAYDNLQAQEETYDLIKTRYQAGLSNELTLQQARYNLESTRSQIPTLRIGLAEAKNRLAVLTGKAPGAIDTLLSETRPIPDIPATVAVGIPAEILSRRPDIRRAERELAAQTAQIGIATADLYPRFRLSGTIGLESLKLTDFFKSLSRFWNWGPAVSWNVFDAGAIRGNIAVQSALQEQSLINYEKAVLSAYEEVENALTTYAEEQFRRERLLEAADAAQQAQDLAQDQYKVGLVDFITVLEAQRSLLSLQDQLAVSDGAVTSDLVQLYKALGGGWESVAPLSKIETEGKDSLS